MKYLIDTSAYTGFNKGDIRLKHIFLTENELIVPLIVIGELRAGFANSARTLENEKLLQLFLDSPNVRTVSPTDKTTQKYAQVCLSSKESGHFSSSNALWIAAHALEYDIDLATTNSGYSAIDGLKVITLDA